MNLIADFLLMAAAFGAAFYCRLLASRLKRLSNTDNGLGGAISTLSYQVDEMKAALAAVSQTSDRRADDLAALTGRAEKSARRLEILLAGLHEEEDNSDIAARPKPALQLSDDDRVHRSTIGGMSMKRPRSRLIMRENRASRPTVEP